VVVALALGLRRQREAIAAAPNERDETENVAATRKLAWLGLSALTCICMLGATRHLSSEIGSNPLSWIIPLGLYLASFSIAFTGWWREGASLICLAALGISLTGFVLLKGVSAEPISGWIAVWLISIVATACLLGNGLLYSLRPQRQFLQYYVVIGVGGMVGGMFSSLTAPNLFSRDYEFLASALLLLIAGLGHLVGAQNRSRLAVASVVIAAPFVGIVELQISGETTKLRRVHHVRNLYGHIQVIQNPSQVVLRSETTTHGGQQIQPESARQRPTLYYIESSGVGTVLRNLQEAKPQLNVGVVGLGAGTLAAYARAEDAFTFWDIDPKVIWVAQTAFSYLADARGKVAVVEDDGRKAIETSRDAFDLLVIDAFSGDSIPAHLLTVEAFEAYLPRLTERDGVLLIHASNRHIELFPVIAANARSLGWEALRVHTAVSVAGRERDFHPSASNYVVVHRPEARAVVDAWFAGEEPDERVARTLTRISAGGAMSPVWSDDRNSILDALNWRRYFEAD
jgi:spermidine synthase